MRRYHVAAVASLTLALVLAPAVGPVVGKVDAMPAAQTGIARVRFVHASFDAPSLDAYADGKLWAARVRGVAGYLDIPPGEHTFSFRLAGQKDDLASVQATLADGQRTTVAAINTLEALQATVIADDVSAPARNAARVKVVHAVPDGGPITVRIDGQVFASDLAFGQASAEGQVFSGTYDIEIAAGDSTLVSEANRAFDGNRAYTLFLVGTATSRAYRIVPAESTVLKPESTSQFRFANMAQGVGPLAVFVNKESRPLYPSVRFSAVTTYFVTGRGPHLFEVYPAGAGPWNGRPLASGSAEIGANENALFVALGTANTLAIRAYSSDLSPLPPNASRLQVVNAATGNPAIRVETMDGTTLFQRVDVAGTASRVVPAGTYNIRFTDAARGSLMMEKTGFFLPAGTATALVAFDDNPADALVNAVAVSTENVPAFASIRWAHLNIWGPPVDLYLDNTRVVSGLAYKVVTDYMLIAPDTYTLAAYPIGADPEATRPLASQLLDLSSPASPCTVYVFGPADEVQFETTRDDAGLLRDGTARVQFINTAIDSGGVNVENLADGSVLAENLRFGVSSVPIEITAGEYAFDFTRDAETVASLGGLVVLPGTVYTVALTGVYGQQPGLETIVMEYRP
jgi:hypothetical protein